MIMKIINADSCDRCNKSINEVGFTMSMFNTDWICLDCADKEANHPQYEEARRAENEALKNRNFNFRGIGLPNDLKGNK